MTKQFQDAFHLLGLRCRDRVTETEGVVVSISFDLYGCVQGLLQYKKEAGEISSWWMDIVRLNPIDPIPVLKHPFDNIEQAPSKGPAEKPVF